MTADLLSAVLRANLALGLAVGAVLVLRRPFRRWFGARAAYGLWIIAPVAVAAGLLPSPAPATPLAPFLLVATRAAARSLPTGATGQWAANLLLGVWLAGALIAAALLALRQARFVASLGPLSAVAGEAGVLRAARPGVGPALVGALRPRIVIPADFEARFDGRERAVILAHERAHLAGGDAVVNALACAAQCLAWFNPLVHLGVGRLRIDQELACDAAVLARFPTDRRLYAEVLLKTQIADRPLPLGCCWPPSGDHPLKERITMLKSPLPARARILTGAALVAALSTLGVGLAWAAQAPAPSIDRPDWVQRPDGDAVRDAYPAKAKADHVAGRAVLGCSVQPAGFLEGCTVLDESPADYGFGAAALKISPNFRMRPTAKGGQVKIPILFRAAPGA